MWRSLRVFLVYSNYKFMPKETVGSISRVSVYS